MGITRNFLCITMFCLLLVNACSEKDAYFTERKDENGRVFQSLLSFQSLAMGIFVQTDADHDGSMDDYLWTRSNLKNPTESMLLFNEIWKNNKISQQIFYGPDNRKLYEKTDLDGDGILETEIFYNAKALPKVIESIIARVQIDTNQDKVPEFIVYPGKRMEWDFGEKLTQFRSHCFTDDPEILQDSISAKATQKDWNQVIASKCKPLLSSRSWYLHPEKIPEPRYRAVFQIN